MRKYLFSIFAVVVAICFSAFSSVKYAKIWFNYSAPLGSYSKANVENEANWLRVDEDFILCHVDLDEQACTIGIESGFLENLTAANLDAMDTNNDLFIKAETNAPAKVLDVRQGSISGQSISPTIYNDMEDH